ncbi:hypothetical protein ACFVW2_13460 [Streptomyces sp. NPDC058171]
MISHRGRRAFDQQSPLLAKEDPFDNRFLESPSCGDAREEVAWPEP